LETAKTCDEPDRITTFGANISNRGSQPDASSGASVLDGRAQAAGKLIFQITK